MGAAHRDPVMPYFPWHRPRIKKKWQEVDRKWGDELVRRWRRQWCLQKLAILARWEAEDEMRLAEKDLNIKKLAILAGWEAEDEMRLAEKDLNISFEEADALADADADAALLGFDVDADAEPSAEQG